MSGKAGEPLGSRLGLPDLAAAIAIFGAGSWAFGAANEGLPLRNWLYRHCLPVGIAAATFWLAMLASETRAQRRAVASIRKLLTACGAVLIAQAAALYFLRIEPVAPLVTLGGIAALVPMLTALKASLPVRAGPRRRGVLFLGFDPVSGSVARSMQQAVLGVLHNDPSAVPPDLPYLGPPEKLEEVAASLQPARIVVSGARSDDFPVSPRLLLHLRLSGVAIENGLASYEEIFGRVFWRHLERSPLKFLPRLGAQRLVMSVQAVYTNLVGLALLVCSLPLLIPASLAVALVSGRGPVLQRVECLGFEGIPFVMLRFRTRRADGRWTSIGRFLARLHLDNLPQLINVVRGEMAFIGPPPVRREFGVRLGQLMEFYPARLTVKPGMFGWSQVSLRGEPVPDESLRLEYDLYYVQEVVPALDLEILFRSIFRRPFLRADREAHGPSGAVS
jgi:lipopolysaccharide/colanic/teichoic acid biosynthesis glycosyltransferase